MNLEHLPGLVCFFFLPVTIISTSVISLHMTSLAYLLLILSHCMYSGRHIKFTVPLSFTVMYDYGFLSRSFTNQHDFGQI